MPARPRQARGYFFIPGKHMNFSKFMCFPGIKKYPLACRGLAGIYMRGNTDVSNLMQNHGFFRCHRILLELPLVMGECLVGFRHLYGVYFFLNARPGIVVSIEE